MADTMSLTQRTAGILKLGGQFPHKYFQTKLTWKKTPTDTENPALVPCSHFISSMAYTLKAYTLKANLIYVRESIEIEAVF